MIELENVSFAYAGEEPCIHGVDLRVAAGECVVFIGRSGNGKTTLTRLINGLAPYYYEGTLSGKLRIGGTDLAEIPQWERAKQIGCVFQDPRSQFFSAELAGEVAFGCENLGFSVQEIRDRTDGVIRTMGLDALRNTPLDRLSSGEKQKVAIASARAAGPRIFTFDEPTANLDEESAGQLSETLAELKRQGHTLVVAEHRLSWLMELADRFLYVDGGRLVREFSPRELALLSAGEAARIGLRRPCKTEPPLLPAADCRTGAAAEARRVCCTVGRKTIFRDIDFSASPGEVVAVTGRNGTGKTTFAKILCGLRRESGGSVLFSGKRLPPGRRRERVFYSANDTNTQFFTPSVEEEVLLLLPRREKELERARETLRRLGLYGYRTRHPATLSGGQKQRLSLACGVLSGRELLIFDEPTSGLDGGNMRIISDMLKQEAENGKTVLVITHDAELMEACCTHIFQMGATGRADNKARRARQDRPRSPV